jgi:hypothetical protein
MPLVQNPNTNLQALYNLTLDYNKHIPRSHHQYTYWDIHNSLSLNPTVIHLDSCMEDLHSSHSHLGVDCSRTSQLLPHFCSRLGNSQSSRRGVHMYRLHRIRVDVDNHYMFPEFPSDHISHHGYSRTAGRVERRQAPQAAAIPKEEAPIRGAEPSRRSWISDNIKEYYS